MHNTTWHDNYHFLPVFVLLRRNQFNFLVYGQDSKKKKKKKKKKDWLVIANTEEKLTIYNLL